MWNVESKMPHDADWSRQQTTWLLSFHRLPHQSLNRQCGNISIAENDARIRCLSMNAIYTI